MMRLFLVSLLVLLPAIYLHLGGFQAIYLHFHTILIWRFVGSPLGNHPISLYNKNIFYYENGLVPNVTAYVKLLGELRSRLASGNDVHGSAVTRPPKTIPLQERFVQVQLQNRFEHVMITVIIDTENVYVVGYTLPPTLYYFKDSPKELLQAFPYNHSKLNFTSNYNSLGVRATIELGHGALNVAIKKLYRAKSFGKPECRALLVIIQMVAEAVRIRYIEHLIRRHMLGKYRDFLPDQRALDLENSWSALSKQIQGSGESGIFHRAIVIQSQLYEDVRIRNVVQVMYQAALGLMLYQCSPKAIGMPTTNIIGWAGQCVSQSNDGNPIILQECGNAQGNQLWTFNSDDGTIRSINGTCLTASGECNITISVCGKRVVPVAAKWIFYNNGTIRNNGSGRVITAEASAEGTVLTLADDYNSSMQAWSGGNYTEPTINYISGLHEMCLQANGAHVWLKNCDFSTTKTTQQWAFYGDSTIRLYSNHSLCVTSNGRKSLACIILFICEGSEYQRWTFQADGTILNPNASLVMDVQNSDVSLKKIILSQPTGNPSQKWLAF